MTIATSKTYKVLVLGGGSGGISVSARLAKSLGSGEIGIIEPSDKHYYQPLWTLVGGGQAVKESTVRNEGDLIPNGVDWIRESVRSVDPDRRLVTCVSGIEIGYEYLIVATGLKLDWGKIEGLPQTLGKSGVCSIYQYDQVDYVKQTIGEFAGGAALFVMPPVPIKCAGAPQKIMYLAEDLFRRNGVRHKSRVHFATAGKAMFGIPAFGNALEEIRKEKGIEAHFEHKLVAVDGPKKEATFEVPENGQIVRKTLKFDMLHVVPTMSAHDYVSASGLAFTEGDQKGWLAVDKFTLQHVRYPNVFGIGDVTGVPNSKTGAAIRAQYPIVATNLLDVMAGRAPSRRYDGYSSCPLVTEIGKVMLAEFGYDGKLMPTFPLDPTVPRTSMWILKKYLLPQLYWKVMLKGLG